MSKPNRVKILKCSSESETFKIRKLLRCKGKWRSKKVCRYPQILDVEVHLPPSCTDLEISVFFEKFYLPKKFEVIVRKKNSNSNYQNKIIAVNGWKDVLHKIKFPLIHDNEEQSIYIVRIILSKSMENEINLYEQVGVRSISFVCENAWNDDLERNLPLQRPKVTVTENEIEVELIKEKYKSLDSRTTKMMRKMIRKKLYLTKKEEFLTLDVLQKDYIDVVSGLGKQLNELEVTKRKLLMIGNDFAKIAAITNEIKGKRKRIERLVEQFENEEVKKKKYRGRKKREMELKHRKKKRIMEEDEDILPHSKRFNRLMKHQRKKLFRIMNTLEGDLEEENTYFPDYRRIKNKRMELFFQKLSSDGFGSGVDKKTVNKSMPPEIYFDRLSRLGMGEEMERRAPKLMDKKMFVHEDDGDRDKVLTERSKRFFKMLRNVGFGQETEKNEVAQSFFKKLAFRGFGE